MTNTSHCAADSIRNIPEINDDASETTVMPCNNADGASQATSMGWKPNGLDNHVENELYTSRVYLRTGRRHSLSSLSTGSISNPGWSFLSGLSLAQMSSIAVVSLPLSLEELWNPRYYTSTDQSIAEAAIGPRVMESTRQPPNLRPLGSQANRLSFSFRNNAEVGLATCPDNRHIGIQPAGLLGKSMRQTLRILLLGEILRIWYFTLV